MSEKRLTEDLLDELDLTTETEALRLRGPAPKGFSLEYTRDITEADLIALNTMPRGAVVPALQRIHSSHHSLARCLAAGMKDNQAALVTGYSPVRVSQLKNDEAFKALVHEYRSEAKSVFADLAMRMSDISLDAIELLQERLQAAPHEFTVPMLLDVIKAFADRTGHGPGSEIHVKMDRDFIDRPPRENFDEWQERRNRELGLDGPKDIKLIN